MSNNSKKKVPGDYEVGYGKPPKHSQYVKGETGNPFGRARQSPDLDAAIAKQLRRKVTITEGGEQRRLRLVDALAMRITSDAAKGRPAAIREVKASMKRRREVEEAEREKSDSDMSDEDIFVEISKIMEHARIRKAHYEEHKERTEAAKKEADEQKDGDKQED